jgi:BolA protein
MERTQWIEETLRAAFAPEHLEIHDDSAAHRGHAGAAGGGGHYSLVIVAAAFEGLDRLARQRAVYAALGDAVGTAIHALALRTLTPQEWRTRAGGGA